MQYLEFDSDKTLITRADIITTLMYGSSDLHATRLTNHMAILNEQAAALINHPSFTTMAGVHRTTIISGENLVSCTYRICDGTKPEAPACPADGVSITLRVAHRQEDLTNGYTPEARKVVSNWPSDYMSRENKMFEQRCVRAYVNDICANATDMQSTLTTMKNTLVYQRVINLPTRGYTYSQIVIQIPLTMDEATFNSMLENPYLATRLF